MSCENKAFDVYEHDVIRYEQDGTTYENEHGEVVYLESFPTLEEAQAYADGLAAEAARWVDVTPTRYGTGSVERSTYEITCSALDEDGEPVYLDADGEETCEVPVLGYADALEHRPDVRRAWDAALKSYRDFLDYQDCGEGYDTVPAILARSSEA